MSPPSTSIVELNVGGVFYTTSLRTLCSDPKSKLCKIFAKIGGNGDSSPTAAEDDSDPDSDAFVSKDSKGLPLSHAAPNTNTFGGKIEELS